MKLCKSQLHAVQHDVCCSLWVNEKNLYKYSLMMDVMIGDGEVAV